MNKELFFYEIKILSSINLDWQKLKNSSILITGATGLIGSVIVHVLMYKNHTENLNCKIFALTRNIESAKKQFLDYENDETLVFICHQIDKTLESVSCDIDFIFHLASNTHPVAYATDPIGTISVNIIGTKNLLDFACSHKTKRFLFTSSCEIYGENNSCKEHFDECDLGFIDCNTSRAGYSESKRCAEALCQAYIKQKGIEVVIPRLCRIYGPTMKIDDSKAISQFIKKALNNEDIVLKSEGNQFYSFLDVFSAVSAIFTILLKGENGNAYNVSDSMSDIRLKDLANMIASQVEKKVIFELPNEIEKSGFSNATKSLLNNKKLKSLGWNPIYDIESGVKHTIAILKD